MSQFKLPDFHTPTMICYPCWTAMEPAIDYRGMAIWKCPKCGKGFDRKTEEGTDER